MIVFKTALWNFSKNEFISFGVNLSIATHALRSHIFLALRVSTVFYDSFVNY